MFWLLKPELEVRAVSLKGEKLKMKKIGFTIIWVYYHDLKEFLIDS